jgi:hypothetical protein
MNPIFVIIFYILAMLMAVTVFFMKITGKPFLAFVLTFIAKVGGIYVIGYCVVMLFKMAKII